MELMVQAIMVILIIDTAQPLYPLRRNAEGDKINNAVLRLLKSIPPRRSGVRSSGFPQAGHILRRRGYRKRHVLRHDQPKEMVHYNANDTSIASARLAELEMKDSLTKNLSSIHHNPYVQKAGRNDFLVMLPGDVEKLATVIPNAMYYNAEKKCANWLDDCSLKGIRERLLRGVRSPYK